MTATAPALVELLDLLALGPDRFVGTSIPMGLPRVFGGQVLAQGLVAAARTVEAGKSVHSLHGYFLRPGDTSEPIEYRVERVRDGRQLSCRTVIASQGAGAIATMTCSFANTAGGVSHQRRAPGSPPAEQVPTLAEASERWGGMSEAWAGIDTLEIRVEPRLIDPTDAVSPGAGAQDPGTVTDHVWQRVPSRLPDDPLLHQALLLYASDITQLAAALVPHGIPLGREELEGRAWDGVSVDHAVWFHRPARADEWLLFEQCTPSAGSGRALTRADVFTAEGVLIASIAQEGIIWDARGEAGVQA